MSKIQASLIIEILGRPPEHITEALHTVVTKIGAEKGIKVLNKTYNEPIKAQDSKTLYTAFAEVDVELDSLHHYFGLIFMYMPANIEITSPEKLTIQNLELNELGNALLQRLHNYDAVAKKMIAETSYLTESLKHYAPHLFKEKEEVSQEEEKKPKENK